MELSKTGIETMIWLFCILFVYYLKEYQLFFEKHNQPNNNKRYWVNANKIIVRLPLKSVV